MESIIMEKIPKYSAKTIIYPCDFFINAIVAEWKPEYSNRT